MALDLSSKFLPFKALQCRGILHYRAIPQRLSQISQADQSPPHLPTLGLGQLRNRVDGARPEGGPIDRATCAIAEAGEDTAIGPSLRAGVEDHDDFRNHRHIKRHAISQHEIEGAQAFVAEGKGADAAVFAFPDDRQTVVPSPVGVPALSRPKTLPDAP
jgi:hypothetical protein